MNLKKIFILTSSLSLLLLSACGSVPKEVKQTISEQRLAGTWRAPKSSYNDKSWVKIYCDGEIEYFMQSRDALIFKEVNNSGNIKEIQDGFILSSNWLGMKISDKYKAPQQDEKGCWKISFQGDTFVTDQPRQCDQPQKSLYAEITEAIEKSNPACFE